MYRPASSDAYINQDICAEAARRLGWHLLGNALHGGVELLKRCREFSSRKFDVTLYVIFYDDGHDGVIK